MTVNKHCYIVDMEPKIQKIVGYMAADVKTQMPVATNAWPRRTCKIYSSSGIAKYAMMNSRLRKSYQNGLISIIPVTIPTEN